MPWFKFTFKIKFRLARVHTHTHKITSDNIPLNTLENTSLWYILKNGIGRSKSKYMESLYQFAFLPTVYESTTFSIVLSLDNFLFLNKSEMREVYGILIFIYLITSEINAFLYFYLPIIFLL